jgi:type I restriction enzyme S subunit
MTIDGIYDEINRLPNNWQRIRLGEVLNVTRGASPRPKGDPKYFGGKIPWIMISDITREPGKFISQTKDHVTEEGAKKSRYLKPGTLILSNSGTVCVPKIMSVAGCIHDGFIAFPELPDTFDRLFLYYYFDFIRPRIINAHRQGITQVNLNTIIVKDIRLIVAPINEQKRIVAEIEKQFSRLDEAVENLQRVKTNLKRYKASVLKAAVEGKLTEQWRSEHPDVEPASQLLEKISFKRNHCIENEIKRGNSEAKRSKTKLKKHKFVVPKNIEIPEGWSWGSFLSVSRMVVDCHNKTAPYEESGIELIRTSNIRDGKMVLDGVKYVSKKTYEYWSRRCPPKPGDLLFTREAPMGEATIIPKGMKVCMGQRIMLVRLFENLICKNFFLYWIMSPIFQTRLSGGAVGTGVKHLRVGDVEALAIPVPPVEEQKEIVRIVDEKISLVEEVEKHLNRSLQKLEALRQSILKKAFSGHLVPNAQAYENDIADDFSLAAEPTDTYGAKL